MFGCTKSVHVWLITTSNTMPVYASFIMTKQLPLKSRDVRIMTACTQFCAGLVPLKESGELTPSLKQAPSARDCFLLTAVSGGCQSALCAFFVWVLLGPFGVSCGVYRRVHIIGVFSKIFD